MQQFQVVKRITEILARTLEASVSEAVGSRVKVAYEYSPDLRKTTALSLHLFGLETRGGERDREYELAGGVEQFRNPPLLLRARYLVSAWAKPPEDQVLLGAMLRTFLDHPYLEPEGVEEEDAVGYAGIPGVDLRPLSLDEHRALAESFQMPLAPSMSYGVDFRIQSGKTNKISRVKERVLDFRKIEG